MLEYGGYTGEVAKMVKKVDGIIKELFEQYKYTPLVREHLVQFFEDMKEALEGEIYLDSIHIMYQDEGWEQFLVENSDHQFMLSVRPDSKGYFGNASWDSYKFVQLYTGEWE
ncbi:hypothetical protein [Phage f2b1]|nr:hypothetical protein [Phage f2b1]